MNEFHSSGKLKRCSTVNGPPLRQWRMKLLISWTVRRPLSKTEAKNLS
jgi:hypothetical protein